MNQPAVTAQQIMDAANRGLAVLLPILKEKGMEDKEGLYLTYQFPPDIMSATMKVGNMPDPEKQEKCIEKSQEKGARLLQFSDQGHKTSRESRDFEIGKYAGAVRIVIPGLVDIIMSASGLPEDADEDFVLYTGCLLFGDKYQAEAYRLAEKSGSDYFFRMLSAKAA